MAALTRVPRQEYSQENENITHVGTAHSSGFCPEMDFKINHISFISSKILSKRTCFLPGLSKSGLSQMFVHRNQAFLELRVAVCINMIPERRIEFRSRVKFICIAPTNKINSLLRRALRHEAKARVTVTCNRLVGTSCKPYL